MILLRKGFFHFCIIIGYLFPIMLNGQAIPTYQGSDGLVVIEIESAIEKSNWLLDTTKIGYTGDGYLLYKGPDLFNLPGNSVLNFKVVIDKPGKYKFNWRSRIALGTSNTEHNDSWLRFKDASDFYGQKNDEKVYPKGVGKTPNPEGSSKDGWMKIYQNVRGGWTWQTRTSDNDPHDIYVEFDTIGTYNLEISGRSNGHAIDRIVLFHSEVSFANATNLDNPESERIETVSTSQVATTVSLKINPTLARDFVKVEIPDDVKSGQYELPINPISKDRK